MIRRIPPVLLSLGLCLLVAFFLGKFVGKFFGGPAELEKPWIDIHILDFRSRWLSLIWSASPESVSERGLELSTRLYPFAFRATTRQDFDFDEIQLKIGADGPQAYSIYFAASPMGKLGFALQEDCLIQSFLEKHDGERLPAERIKLPCHSKILTFRFKKRPGEFLWQGLAGREEILFSKTTAFEPKSQLVLSVDAPVNRDTRVYIKEVSWLSKGKLVRYDDFHRPVNHSLVLIIALALILAILAMRYRRPQFPLFSILLFAFLLNQIPTKLFYEIRPYPILVGKEQGEFYFNRTYLKIKELFDKLEQRASPIPSESATAMLMLRDLARSAVRQTPSPAYFLEDERLENLYVSHYSLDDKSVRVERLTNLQSLGGLIDKRTLLILGGSQAFGSGASRPSLGVSDLLANELVKNKCFERVLIFAQGGHALADQIELFGKHLPQAHSVFALFGYNEANAESALQASQNLKNLLRQGQTRFHWVHSLQKEGFHTAPFFELLQRELGVPIVDLTRAQPRLQGHNSWRDTIHPTDYGHRVLAEEIMAGWNNCL